MSVRTIIIAALAGIATLSGAGASAQPQETKAVTQPTQIAEADIRVAVTRYFEGTRSMNAAQWASAFAPTAVVRDPIAAPPLTTPAQILAQGEGFVNAFSSVALNEVYVSVHGDEAMAYWVGRGEQKDGARVRFEGVNHFRFGPDGKIIELRGFWDPADIRPE